VLANQYPSLTHVRQPQRKSTHNSFSITDFCGLAVPCIGYAFSVFGAAFRAATGGFILSFLRMLR
jgi:hypothetical protein